MLMTAAGEFGADRRSRWISATLTVAWRSLHTLFRNPAILIPPLIMPIFFFAAFAGGLSALGSDVPGFNYPDYDTFQLVFVLLQSAAFGGVFTGFAIAMDFETGFSKRLLLSSHDRSAIIAGYALVALVRAALVMAVVVLVAVIAGAEITGNGLDLFGMFGLALLLNVAAVLFSAGVALRVRSMQGAPLMQIPVFVFLLTAPVYVPIDLIEGWVNAVAHVNPITPLLEAGRSLAIGDPVKVVLALAIVVGLVTVMVAWALRGMRNAEKAA